MRWDRIGRVVDRSFNNDNDYDDDNDNMAMLLLILLAKRFLEK